MSKRLNVESNVLVPRGKSSERPKVLIINPGYRETLAPDPGDAISLGDILRSTVILHLYPSDLYHVTWLVDPAGADLLEGNDQIARILKVNAFSGFQLMSERFDIVINLESDPGVCAMADKIAARHHYGFRFDPITGEAQAYAKAEEALSMSRDMEYKRRQDKSWSELLFNILGRKYNDEPLILGYKPQTSEIYDVGLNHKVGSKFPLKRWPMENWKALAARLEPEHSVSWQQSANDITGYIDWINSCRVLVTNDSLGLHIGLALNKRVVALFGPTIASEFSPQENLVKLGPGLDWDCIPCLESKCEKSPHCMAYISQDRVAAATLQQLQLAQFSGGEAQAANTSD